MTHLATPSRTRSSLGRGLRSASDDVNQIFRLVLYRIEDGFDLVLDEVGWRAWGHGRSSGVGGGLLFARGGLTGGGRGGVGARRRRIGSADGGGPGGTRLRGRGGGELRLVVRVDGHGHDLRLKVGVDQFVLSFYCEHEIQAGTTSVSSYPNSSDLGHCKTIHKTQPQLTLIHPNLFNPRQNILNLLPPYHLTRTRKDPTPPPLPEIIRLTHNIHHLCLHLLFRSVEPSLNVFPQRTGLEESRHGLFGQAESVDPSDVFRGSEEEGGHEDSIFWGLRGGGVDVGDEGDVEVSWSMGGEPGFDGEDSGCGRGESRGEEMISRGSTRDD